MPALNSARAIANSLLWASLTDVCRKRERHIAEKTHKREQFSSAFPVAFNFVNGQVSFNAQDMRPIRQRLCQNTSFSECINPLVKVSIGSAQLAGSHVKHGPTGTDDDGWQYIVVALHTQAAFINIRNLLRPSSCDINVRRLWICCFDAYYAAAAKQTMIGFDCFYHIRKGTALSRKIIEIGSAAVGAKCRGISSDFVIFVQMSDVHCSGSIFSQRVKIQVSPIVFGSECERHVMALFAVPATHFNRKRHGASNERNNVSEQCHRTITYETSRWRFDWFNIRDRRLNGSLWRPVHSTCPRNDAANSNHQTIGRRIHPSKPQLRRSESTGQFQTAERLRYPLFGCSQPQSLRCLIPYTTDKIQSVVIYWEPV